MLCSNEIRIEFSFYNLWINLKLWDQYLMSVGCSSALVSSKSSSDSELSSPSLLDTSTWLLIVSGLVGIDASSAEQRR